MSRDEQLYLAAMINADRVQKLLELRHSAYQQQQQQQQTKGASSSSSSFESKPTIHIKNKFIYTKQKKLGELGAIIRGTSYPSLEPMFLTKGASSSEVVAAGRKPGPIEREVKLKELGKMIKGM